MHKSVFFLSFICLLCLVSCQTTYLDVNVCHGFDYTAAVTVTVTPSTGGKAYTQTIQPATCQIFSGIGTGTGTGQTFTITTAQIGTVTPYNSGPLSFISNSCYNTWVLIYATGSATALTAINPNGTPGDVVPVASTYIHMVLANYGSDSYFGDGFSSFSSLNVTANLVSGGKVSLGPVDHLQSAFYDTLTGTQSFASGSLPQAQGIYRNSTGSHLVLPVTFANTGVTYPTITAPSCFYMMLYGSVGANFDGSGYKFISSGGVTEPGIGYVFLGTGSAPSNSTGTSSSTGPSNVNSLSSSSSGNGNGGPSAAFASANVSPFLFIAIALFALLATRF